MIIILVRNVAGAVVDSDLKDRFMKGVGDSSRIADSLRIKIREVTTREFSNATVEADNSAQARKIAREQGLDLSRITLSRECAYSERSVLSRGIRDGDDFVMALNPDYVFHITKAPSVDVYTIRWLEATGNADPQLEEVIQSRRRSARALLTAAWSYFGEPLNELVESEEFRISHVEEISSDDKTLVRVEFDRMEEKFRPGGSLSDAYLVCDPSKMWSLVEYAATWHDIDGDPFMRKEMSVEIGDVVDGVPLVRSKRQTDTWIDKPENIDTATMTLEILGTDVPDEIFRLSHYGLPEPNFEREWYGTWLVYLLGGVTCLTAAYAIRRRRAAA